MTESREVLTANGRVVVRCAGRGEPAVILLHGIPGSSASWAAVADLLAARSRVVVPDLVGFGASARSTDVGVLHAAGQAATLAEVLSRLRLDRVVVVGHDFGGPVGLMLAAGRPGLVAALGLLATNAFPDTPVPFPLSSVTWPVVGSAAVRALFSGPSLRLMVRAGVGSPRPLLDVAAAVGDRAQRRAIRTIFAASLTRMADLYGPVEAALGRIAVPTLVGWGDRDPFFPVEQGRRTAAAVAGARFRLYPGAGHFLPDERPREVAADVAELVGAGASLL